MNKEENKEDKPKVVIGSNYRRPYFEDRSNGSYAALNPYMSGDANLIQSALLNNRAAAVAYRAEQGLKLIVSLVAYFWATAIAVGIAVILGSMM